ncbi:efflux RND transporter permease subunit [Planomicrobium sp. YIM 101495]|uniref:efflux RND transporter permease subunit n=1 Tax=Planomicrobium sp. YIM 101495 TaxID=2665160 RepID=UPI0012B7D960|nr:efflux RND transporter permease subunit [Planomicrobium sp. YIM 101495]MTD30422.1 MMPL family transporter [Planomicrobium sp. YIM 101495]
MHISDFSIKRPVLTLVVMFLVIIIGAVSFFRIPVTLIPELNPPIGVVVTNYQGASPTEVSEKVTKPLEQTLSTLPGIESVQSISQEGSNLILLQFSWLTDINDVHADVLQRIDQTPIPDDAGSPRFLKFDPSQFPVIQMSLQSGDNDADIRVLAERLETELLQTEGVANVNISGTLIEDIVISLNAEELEARGLQQSDIVQVIQANNVSLPGEPIETEDGKQLTTRILSTISSAEQIGELIVTVNPLDGNNVTIADVADVSVKERDASSETRASQQPAVLLSALQESGANTADVSTAFQEKLAELLEEEEFAGIKADVLFDQGDYIQLAVGNIGQTLLFGGLFAMLVLFFFLKGIKSPIIIGVAIPYSVIVTFVLMFFADFALNILTLGALALGIGMLVDNSIVVIENIQRHLTMDKSPKKAASEGTKEVAGAITASTLTTVVVFVPVIFISGLIGEIFFEFALTIAFSLVASLAVALTVIPMLAARLLPKPKGDYEARRRRSKSLKNFERSVEWALKHRLIIFAITAVLTIVAVFGLTRVGTEFLPATDEGFVSVQVELDNGSSRTATDEVVQIIEQELEKEDDVDVYVALIGTTQQGQAQGSSSSNTAELYIKLNPLDERERSVFEFVDDVQPKMKELVGDRAEVNFVLQTAAGSAPNTLNFTVTDIDPKRLDDAVERIDKELRDLSGVTELTSDREETLQEIQITVDQEAAVEQGLAPVQIAQSVNNITRGVQAAQVIAENDDVLSVFVEYEEAERDSVEKLRTLSLRTPSGQFVELQDLAAVEIAEGPVSIQRVDQAESVSFTLQHMSDLTLGEMSTRVDEAIDGLDLESGTTISFGGDRELFDDAIGDMTLALILAVVLVYLVMAAQFESFKYPFVIMFTVPLMLIGVALALLITQTPISISAIIGILVLVGIVVNNGIVLVDYINQRKAMGIESYEAIKMGVRDRLRPILMTALTTVLGLLPLALGIGEGTEINQPMGIAVIGGIVTSTLLTLYVVPVVYSMFDRETRRMNKKA